MAQEPQEQQQDEQPQQRDPEQIREEIDQTREEMGETVEALAEKADVKAQAQEKVDDVKAQARDRVESVASQARARFEEVKSAVAEKREQFVGGSTTAGDSTTGPGIAADAPPVGGEASGPSIDASQVAATAKENPVPFAVGAFVAGFLLGRITSR